MVVLHYTGMQSARAAADRLCDPAAEVSAHYLIGADGAVLALVAEELRAWHAGISAWGGVTDVNSRSIGIELDNPGHELGYPPFPEPQLAALETLLAGVMARWAILPERVVGHACVAPGRKIDPGEKLDWRRLARRGLAVWLDGPTAGAGLGRDPADAARFRAAARAFGYPVGEAPSREAHCWTEALRAVWRSFSMRFRPHDVRAGPHEAGLRHIEALAARWPAATGGSGARPVPPAGQPLTGDVVRWPPHHLHLLPSSSSSPSRPLDGAVSVGSVLGMTGNATKRAALLAEYLAGVQTMDPARAMQAAAPEYKWYDGLVTEPITRDRFAEYLIGWEDRMRSIGGTGRYEVSDELAADQDGYILRWAWWKFLGTNVEGSTLLKVGDEGVIYEKIAYFRPPAA